VNYINNQEILLEILSYCNRSDCDRDIIDNTRRTRLLNEARYRLSYTELNPLWKFFMTSSPLSTLPSQLHVEDFTVSAPEQVDVVTSDMLRSYQVQKFTITFPQGTLTNEFDWTVTLKAVYPLAQWPKPLEKGQQKPWFDMVLSNGSRSHSLLKVRNDARDHSNDLSLCDRDLSPIQSPFLIHCKCHSVNEEKRSYWRLY
jgi:hypothetical protein